MIYSCLFAIMWKVNVAGRERTEFRRFSKNAYDAGWPGTLSLWGSFAHPAIPLAAPSFRAAEAVAA